MTEDEAMGRAIALAARGLGTTSPNPVVGCLLLDADGRVVVAVASEMKKVAKSQPGSYVAIDRRRAD